MKSFYRQGKHVWIAAVVALVVGALASLGVSATELVPVKTIPVTTPGTSGRGLAVTADGAQVIVAGIQDKSLVKLDVKTGAVLGQANLAAVDGGAYGKAAWVDADGLIWAPLTVPTIAVYTSDLELKASYNLASLGVKDAEGAVVSAAGEVYVTDRKGLGGVYKFHQEGSELVPTAGWAEDGHLTLGKDFRQPALAPNGDLLVASYGGSEIYRVSAANGSVKEFATGIKAPFHLAADAAGRVYVVHYSRADVALTIFESNGSVVGTWSGKDLGIQSEASGVAVSADGKQLFVLDQRPSDGGSLLVFDIR